ncbi:MAG TPA: SURF1 family protein [Gemmatimonadales bacterium]
MRRSAILFLVIAAAAAFLFVRLGFWQLGRLQERKTRNAVVAVRLDSAMVGPELLPADTGLLRYRRVAVSGVYDHANEVILAGRTRQGSPGVNFYTPLRIPGRDTAILVNRGWVYSPDATDVDAARWREPARAEVRGFALPFPAPGRGDPVIHGRERTLRHPELAAMRELIPYPIAGYYLVQTDTTDFDIDSTPARLAPPALDEGPHLSYALQWFSFAAIALGGAGVMAWNGRKGKERGGSTSDPLPGSIPR